MKLPLRTIDDPELIVGLVGRIGTDLKRVVSQIQVELSMLHYECVPIHLTDYIHSIKGIPPLREHPTEERYRSYIEACNHIREETGRDDYLAFIAISAIRHERKRLTGDFNNPRKRIAYIVNQLKRPEEIGLLRQVYGPLFIPISCHAHKEDRLRYMARKISADHPENPKPEPWQIEAIKLLDQDEAEEAVPHGQRVRDAFPLADLIVDASDEIATQQGLNRYFRGLFGDYKISPTRDESGANLAVVASLQSVDPSRQVGAAITNERGDVIALGCNEVPKFGGGIYWFGDDPDGRDFRIGRDENTVRKRNMVLEIVSLLRDNGYLHPTKITNETSLSGEFLDKKDALLKDTLIMDTLEFGRCLHAEMCAITDAARNGISTRNATLYTTTFPCHNCAKHVVGVGITRVVYQKPFPKSAVAELYPDSVVIDAAGVLGGGKVAFEQFVGITSNRYGVIFEKERLKNDAGFFQDWQPTTAQPATNLVIRSYLDVESGALADIESDLPEKYKAHLSSPVAKAAE
jgi:cytidine deaminase